MAMWVKPIGKVLRWFGSEQDDKMLSNRKEAAIRKVLRDAALEIDWMIEDGNPGKDDGFLSMLEAMDHFVNAVQRADMIKMLKDTGEHEAAAFLMGRG